MSKDGLVSFLQMVGLRAYSHTYNTLYCSISKSSKMDLSLSVPERRLSLVFGSYLSLHINTESGGHRRFLV